MSLPSKAIYYNKNGQTIHEDFINIGWFMDEDAWINVIKEQVFKVQNCVIVDVYDIKFPIRWKHPKYEALLRQLYQERNEAYRCKSNIDGHHDKIRAHFGVDKNPPVSEMSKILIPMIRRIIPSVIAQEIVGVQPMAESSSLVWSMRYRYCKVSWWKRFTDIMTKGDPMDVVWTTLRDIALESREAEFLISEWVDVRNTLHNLLQPEHTR